VSLGGPKSVEFLAKYTDFTQPKYRAWAAAALAKLDLKQGTAEAVRLINSLGPAELTELLTTVVGRTGGAATLTHAVLALNGTVNPDAARIGVRVAKAAGTDGVQLAAAFTKVGKLSDSRWALAGADLDTFLAELPKADPVRGEAIYRRAELQCLKCHAVAGAGGVVGPEMTSIGASAQPDYLIESLLNPSAKIKEGYNSLTVVTEDGRTATGIKVRETDAELVLRDADDKLLTFPKADIASRKDGKSLMPEGLVDSLTRQELLDLTRFLSELGKGPFAATPGRTVRTWEVLQPTREAFALLGRKGFGAIPTEPGLSWAAAYSVVAGGLPVADLPTVQVNRESPRQAAVRFRVEVTTPGTVKLVFPDPAGLSLWVDGVPAAVAKETPLDLPAGVRTLTVGVEPGNRTTPLRIELADAPGSPARASVVGGK
jgi:putative heme-binding domain-containing protein